MADLKLYFSADGTSAGAEAELECQDALTINTGKGISIKQYKNCQHTNQTSSGFQITTTFGPEAPLGTAQALVWAAHKSGSNTYFWCRDADTGGMVFQGSCKVAVDTISSPTKDEKVFNLTLGAVGDVQDSVTA